MAKVKDLIVAYEPIFLERSRDFNALTTVHLSENDHTNILCEILNMKIGDKKPFMESFMSEVLGITDKMDCNNLVAKTQVKALGTKTQGYIDLLIEEKNHKFYIIVENKVCRAGDGEYQLFRYYFSFYYDAGISVSNYYTNTEAINTLTPKIEEWWTQPKIESFQANNPNIYVVYLTDTKDASDSGPNPKSLPKNLETNLNDHYISISYEEHIYDWLKNTVLPIIPYGKTGDAHMSIILYLRELENILGSNGSLNQWYLEKNEVQDFINKKIIGNATTNVDKYNALNKEYDNLKEATKQNDYKENSILADLISCVLCWRNNVFGQFAPEGWIVYCASNYITFFPTRWLDKFGGTNTSCIHFIIKPWNNNNISTFDLDIHNSACKKYMNDYNTYKDRYDDLMKRAGKIKRDIQDSDLVNHKAAEENYKQSNHYNWHLQFDTERIKDSNGKQISWNPEDAKSFFNKIVELDEIKNLVKYIDDNFKKD